MKKIIVLTFIALASLFTVPSEAIENEREVACQIAIVEGSEGGNYPPKEISDIVLPPSPDNVVYGPENPLVIECDNNKTAKQCCSESGVNVSIRTQLMLNVILYGDKPHWTVVIGGEKEEPGL